MNVNVESATDDRTSAAKVAMLSSSDNVRGSATANAAAKPLASAGGRGSERGCVDFSAAYANGCPESPCQSGTKASAVMDSTY
eukprot:gene1455-biopygen9198